MSQTEYNKDSITVMTDIGHIRSLPGMYVGEGIDARHLFSEGFDNALDESQSGDSKLTEVFVDTSERRYTVRDYGRGIPIGEIQNVDGKMTEVLEVLTTKSFSGGKFDGSVAYKISTGLHGVGLCCCNALSRHFEICTRVDGQMVYLSSERGEMTNLIKVPTTGENGVEISFVADDDIFISTKIPLDFIEDRCRVAKAFGHNIRLYVDGNEIEIKAEILTDLIPAEKDVSIYTDFILKDRDETSGEFINVAVRYTSDTSYKLFGYTNLLYNRYGGTHTRLLQRAIVDVWNRFSKEFEINLHDGDFLVGLRSLVAVFITNTAFSSQTKEKLSSPNKEVQPLIDMFKESFYKELKNNPEMRKALIKRFQDYRNSQNRLTSKKEIMDLVKLNDAVGGKSIRRRAVVPGLIECTSTDRDGTEIYLVEGDSAAGPAMRARSKTHQSILPLRGKIKNTTFLSHADAIKSGDVAKIVNAVGAGIGDDTDPLRSRYERVIILADADPDGKHIIALDISCFINHMAPIVKAGMLYVVIPPLFGYGPDGNRKYANTFDDLPDDIKASGKFTRYKGLGEFDDDELKEVCLTPGKRNIYRIEYPENLDDFNHILGTTEGRRSLLENRGVIVYQNEIDESEEEKGA